MAPIIFLLPKRSIVFPIGIITASTLAIFIVIDSVVFALFRFHLGGVIWSMITSGAAKEIIELSWLEYILAFLIIGFILFIESFLALRIWKRVKKKNSYSPSLWWIVFFFFCLYFSYNMLLLTVLIAFYVF